MPDIRKILFIGVLAGLGYLFYPSVYEAWKQANYNALPIDAVSAMHASDKVTIYALAPFAEKLPSGKNYLYRWKTLGHTDISKAQAEGIFSSMQKDVSQWDGKASMWFEPLYAVSVKSKSGQKIDMLLCYECNQVYVYENGTLIKEAGIAGSGKAIKDALVAKKIPVASSPTREERQTHRKQMQPGWFAMFDKDKK